MRVVSETTRTTLVQTRVRVPLDAQAILRRIDALRLMHFCDPRTPLCCPDRHENLTCVSLGLCLLTCLLTCLLLVLLACLLVLLACLLVLLACLLFDGTCGFHI